MTKNAYRLWIAALLLGWAFDFLFWKKSVGINLPIILSLCLVIGLLLLWSYGIRPARSTLGLLVPMLFFAVLSVFRREPLTQNLAFAFVPLCAGLLAVTFQGGRWLKYSLADYGVKFIRLLVSMVVSPAVFSMGAYKEQAESRANGGRAFPVGPVVRGFAIAVPVLVVFSYLFAYADLVYNRIVTDFFEYNKLAENVIRLALILGFAYGIAGAFLHAAKESTDARLLGEETQLFKPFLGFIEASIVLGSLGALFMLFVSIQFQYFFGGKANIGVEGMTYSQYARRGFNELAVVGLLSLLLTLGLSAVTRRSEGRERTIFSALCAFDAALVMVMLVSAWQRLSLAIDWHGYSRLRLYPRIFIIWVGILLITVIALEFLRHERYFPLAALLASIGFAATLGLYDVDAAIVRYNVQREVRGKYLNIYHLSSLSLDAVPALVDAFRNTHLPQSTREGAGAALLCMMHNDPNWAGLEEDWRSFNYSLWLANQDLLAVKPELQDFQVNDEVTQIRVRTPSDKWYDCAVAPVPVEPVEY